MVQAGNYSLNTYLANLGLYIQCSLQILIKKWRGSLVDFQISDEIPYA